MNNLVIFASGGGSNFKTIFFNTLDNTINNSKVNLVVSNNPNCDAVRFAKSKSVDTFIINNKIYPNTKDYDCALTEKLLEYEPNLIVLAGYMKLIPKMITDIFDKKIINIHPGKLPDLGGKGFYGMNVHKAVIDRGLQKTAVTIHYVNERYDEGMTIHEEIIDVMSDDTPESLSDRVLKYEHQIYSKVINKILNGEDSNEKKSTN